MVLLHCCCCIASSVLTAVLHWGRVLPIRKMGGPVEPPETTASSQSTAHPAETVLVVHTHHAKLTLNHLCLCPESYWGSKQLPALTKSN